MESAGGTTASLRAHLVDRVISKLLSNNIDDFFPIGLEFTRTSSFSNVTDKDSVSWLKSHTFVSFVIIMFAFGTRLLAVSACYSVCLCHFLRPFLCVSSCCGCFFFCNQPEEEVDRESWMVTIKQVIWRVTC